MRDRLIEFLKGARKKSAEIFAEETKKWLQIGEIPKHKQTIDEIEADYLLENGVKLPPVQIGQELWDIHYNRPRKWEVCYLGFNGEEWFINLQYFKNKNDFATRQTSSKFLGKLFYFSREEAEQALKGGNER